MDYLNPWIPFFFENKSRCPICGEFLNLYWGCVNDQCELCKASVEGDDLRKNELRRYNSMMAWYERRYQAMVKRRREKMGTIAGPVKQKKYAL